MRIDKEFSDKVKQELKNRAWVKENIDKLGCLKDNFFLSVMIYINNLENDLIAKNTKLNCLSKELKELSEAIGEDN